ncbi:MAG TPA: hypothetical protein VHH15_19180 [Actinophytocola sp.]|nr:hypothetical protein [Actinophytocola sp.]
MRAVLVVLSVLLVAGCGSSEPAVSTNDLFQEYIDSTDVRNDRFPAVGSTDDRLSNIAAYYDVEQFQAVLLRAYQCDGSEELPMGEVPECDVDIDADGELYARSVVVRHADASLELVTLYVAHDSGRPRLFDRTGQRYDDLEDFRANNELFDSDDTILTLRDITSVPGEGEIVTVTGRTPQPTWQWWLLGGVTLAAALAGVLARRRATRRDDAGTE